MKKGNRINWALRVCLLLAGVSVIAPAADASQGPQYDQEVLREARGIFNRVMSPFCPGQTLSNCGSGAADVLRGQIRQRLADGETADEIMASLVEKYGVKVLAEPPKRGFASLVWIGPIVLLVVGAIMVVVYLRRHTAHQSQSADAGEIDPAVKARVEEELAYHRG